MAVPHRDYVPRGSALGPDHDDHSFFQKIGTDEPGFTIVEPIIAHDSMHAFKHLCRIREIKAAFPQGDFALALVKRDFHV
jgi:hypothetical protein